MLKWFLMALLQRLLILIVLVVTSVILPFASFWLVRNPLGGQLFFWAAPWTCAFWSILAYNLIGSKFWCGREAAGTCARSPRALRGCLLHCSSPTPASSLTSSCCRRPRQPSNFSRLQP